MPTRPSPQGGSAGKRGRRPKHPSGLPKRQAQPRQIAARVDAEYFTKLEVLRRVLGEDNGAIVSRGLDAVIRDLPRDQRQFFDTLLAQMKG